MTGLQNFLNTKFFKKMALQGQIAFFADGISDGVTGPDIG